MEEIPDILETNGKGMRFLFEQGNKCLCLFSFSYKNDELYIGSSQNKVMISPNSLGEFIPTNDRFGIIVDPNHPEEEYTSLKFSFHASGERHLRAKNKSNKDVEFYKEIKSKLTSLTVPESLFKLVSKRISLYETFSYEVKTRKGRNAIKLNTPLEYSNHKNIFEFYISNSEKKEVVSTLIKGKADYLVVRLKTNLFLHILYYIISPENHTDNTTYPDREFFLFTDNNKPKYFTFK
ncbi:MAG TPA: hypothetical protein VK796_12700 [Cytophaga sp.]|jgi:hypothetical protein|nr:hypothetical protein [Cytophaga sp.]